jgi:preprotein translocase subunit SecA
VDYQLRGRAGRQGDPGESRFFVSLEDDLFARFGLHDVMPRFIRESDGLLENPIVAREIARAQRILEGQNFEIRQTLDRYARIVDDQQHHIQAWRRAILTGEEQPRIWLRSAGERASLVAAAGEQAVAEAERVVTLSCIDLAWQDHLAFCADLREGIHLVRLGNQDPLTEFAKAAIHAFARIRDEIEADVLARLAKIRTVDSRIDLASAGVSRPGATWTYLVNDDPFKNRIGALLTGPGRTTVAIYAAAIVTPLLILWGVVDRFVRRRNPPSSK